MIIFCAIAVCCMFAFICWQMKYYVKKYQIEDIEELLNGNAYIQSRLERIEDVIKSLQVPNIRHPDATFPQFNAQDDIDLNFTLNDNGTLSLQKNSAPAYSGLQDFIDSMEEHINSVGIFKRRKRVLDFIFKANPKMRFDTKTIAHIFSHLHSKGLLKESKGKRAQLSFDMNDPNYLKAMQIYCYWYEQSTGKVERVGKAIWRYKPNAA